MAIVAEGNRSRLYLAPDAEHVRVAESADPSWKPEVELHPKALGFRVPGYGLTSYGDLFTDRQLVALTTFSDLVGEARAKALEDAEATFRVRGLPLDPIPLAEGGRGPQAYADALATYVGLTASKLSAFVTTQARWRSGESKSAPAFGRQAIPMVWDFAEVNPFAGAGGDWQEMTNAVQKVLQPLGRGLPGNIVVQDACSIESQVEPPVINTDPPYYDNRQSKVSCAVRSSF